MALKQFLRNLSLLGSVDVPELQTRVIEQAKQLQDQEERHNTFYSLTNSIFGNYFVDGVPQSDVIGAINQSMRISTVFTCVLVRGETLSTLPASVKQSTDLGSRTAFENPVHRLIHDKPNPFQTASSFWKTVSAHIDLHGNCFVKVIYSRRFQPKRLDIIECPDAVEVAQSADGNAYYNYDGKQYKDYEMLHFKDLCLDGYRGCSKIKHNADTMGYARKLRNFGSNAIGVKPPGYFSTEAPFDVIKAQEKNLTAGWTENITNGKIPFLPLGLKYMNIQISPGDAQYLEAIGATKEDIYGIFRVPPTLAQNYERATFANAEQQDLVFMKYTMLPIVTNIEQECNAKLFSEANTTSATPYYVKFNVNAMLRGDFKTRTEGYRSLFQIGGITGNMIADLEDWNHYEGGDEHYVPMNMIPVSMVPEFIKKLTEPVKTNAGDEGGADNDKRSEVFQGIIYNNKNNGKPVNGHAN